MRQKRMNECKIYVRSCVFITRNHCEQQLLHFIFCSYKCSQIYKSENISLVYKDP